MSVPNLRTYVRSYGISEFALLLTGKLHKWEKPAAWKSVTTMAQINCTEPRTAGHPLHRKVPMATIQFHVGTSGCFHALSCLTDDTFFVYSRLYVWTQKLIQPRSSPSIEMNVKGTVLGWLYWYKISFAFLPILARKTIGQKNRARAWKNFHPLGLVLLAIAGAHWGIILLFRQYL